MSDNTPVLSNTAPSGVNNGRAASTVPQCILVLVEQYQKGEITKAEAVLSIQEELASQEEGGDVTQRNEALGVYLGMLDEVNTANREALGQGVSWGSSCHSAAQRSPRTEAIPTGFGAGHASFKSLDRGQSPSSSDDEARGLTKQKCSSINENQFSWSVSSFFQLAWLEPNLRRVLDLLKDWASDPTYVIWKILLSPGCPDFPPDQWLNIVKGQAVDLSKVLGAHYSTEVETKQSHDLSDLFQLSVQVPK